MPGSAKQNAALMQPTWILGPWPLTSELLTRRIDADDAQVHHGHERHGRLDEAEHVNLQVATVVQGNEASVQFKNTGTV